MFVGGFVWLCLLGLVCWLYYVIDGVCVLLHGVGFTCWVLFGCLLVVYLDVIVAC